MGKKRKVGAARHSEQKAQKNENFFQQTKFDINETFDDSDDEFQAGRDRILLEEAPESKRRRKLEEQDAIFQPSDEEVLGFDSLEEDDFSEEDEEEAAADDDDGKTTDGSSDNNLESSNEFIKRRSRPKRDAGSVSDGSDDETGIGAWGTSKKDYYNADRIETEADALEEEYEAKKIQQRQLKAMKEEDFGFNEQDWLGPEIPAERQDDAADGIVTEVLPQIEFSENMTPEEQLKILETRYPEFELLRKDFVALLPTYENLKSRVASLGQSTYTAGSVPTILLKFRALSAYLGSVSMYFAILTSTSQSGSRTSLALSPAELREHSVMKSLVSCRKSWDTVKSFPEQTVTETQLVEVEPFRPSNGSALGIDRKKEKGTEKKTEKKREKITALRDRTNKAELARKKAKLEAEARHAEKLRQTEANLADLSHLITNRNQTSKSQKTKLEKAKEENDGSDFGDEEALTAHEAEEKAKKKRSLRFYTSQIAQKANKRDAAGRDAGGDQDLPYRERLKDRQARLNAEAEKRGRRQADKSEQLGGDSDEEDRRVAAEVRGDASDHATDDDEYYDIIAARSRQRKADKKMKADAFAQAAREDAYMVPQEEIGPDGKRAITYQIEKNKGLAPKRNKDVRNPRVKKRKKYEQKKKKLGSVRQIYRGGEGRGGYGGELTGIKKNLVKSVKL